MNSDKIEIAPFDNLLVYKKGYTPEFVVNIISQQNLGGLRIFSILKDDRLDDVDFLRDYTFLEGLDITATIDYDFNFLKSLVNLKKLSINVEGSKEIDLSGLNKLEYLSIQWRKKIKGIENCTSLASVCVIDFKENDLKKLSALNNLSELRIKTSSIGSLDGLEQLSNLQILTIGNSKKLTSVKAINGLLKLAYLEFNICPNIKDYSNLTNLPSLQKFILIDCGKLDSIQFIEKYPILSELSLLGNTDVADGNLLPAKNIESVQYKHRSHYNIKLENAAYNKIVSDNLQKLKNLFK